MAFSELPEITCFWLSLFLSLIYAMYLGPYVTHCKCQWENVLSEIVIYLRNLLKVILFTMDDCRTIYYRAHFLSAICFASISKTFLCNRVIENYTVQLSIFPMLV